MDNELFDYNEMNFIFQLIAENIISLKKIPDYNVEQKKLQKAKEEISNYPKDVQNIFNKALSSFENTSNYEICLGYFLGLKKGMEIKKLK